MSNAHRICSSEHTHTGRATRTKPRPFPRASQTIAYSLQGTTSQAIAYSLQGAKAAPRQKQQPARAQRLHGTVEGVHGVAGGASHHVPVVERVPGVPGAVGLALHRIASYRIASHRIAATPSHAAGDSAGSAMARTRHMSHVTLARQPGGRPAASTRGMHFESWRSPSPARRTSSPNWAMNWYCRFMARATDDALLGRNRTDGEEGRDAGRAANWCNAVHIVVYTALQHSHSPSPNSTHAFDTRRAMSGAPRALLGRAQSKQARRSLPPVHLSRLPPCKW